MSKKINLIKEFIGLKLELDKYEYVGCCDTYSISSVNRTMKQLRDSCKFYGLNINLIYLDNTYPTYVYINKESNEVFSEFLPPWIESVIIDEYRIYNINNIYKSKSYNSKIGELLDRVVNVVDKYADMGKKLSPEYIMTLQFMQNTLAIEKERPLHRDYIQTILGLNPISNSVFYSIFREIYDALVLEKRDSYFIALSMYEIAKKHYYHLNTQICADTHLEYSKKHLKKYPRNSIVLIYNDDKTLVEDIEYVEYSTKKIDKKCIDKRKNIDYNKYINSLLDKIDYLENHAKKTKNNVRVSEWIIESLKDMYKDTDMSINKIIESLLFEKINDKLSLELEI